jgi:hypothetical protein
MEVILNQRADAINSEIETIKKIAEPEVLEVKKGELQVMIDFKSSLANLKKIENDRSHKQF